MANIGKITNIKLDAKELRDYEPTKEEVDSVKRNNIYIIVDNVLDTFNIGSIFRLADAIAASKIFLVGETAVPDDPKVGHRIRKASVGTDRWVEWEHVNSVRQSIQRLRAQGSRLKQDLTSGDSLRKTPDVAKPGFSQRLNIVAIEQADGSLDYRKAKLAMPVALIVGHETRGVSKESLELADIIVELPLYGVNKSLNVLVALSIISYKILE